ncbi:HNH endonuclease [Tepidibacter formicigenes]|jgi:5-methylcytosine-specific restriction endonuclease McrA|uniref:Putative HNH nuclease YajD n=1 Tax=Tepidibacter formicigenes DSM 15518 TaxID=1123349 RepID=A0A1M6SP62_9FIRM|nr:HNH endonuclease [Tepidibacter formicigenes]SHK46420.1 HNH endonuclease [Tepidibacter formicigenes DSM 15518]
MYRFYKSTKWKNTRKKVLKRDNNECQRCKEAGRFHKAECVHHIKHLKDRPDLALMEDNLISLCYTCHNEVHPEKLHLSDKPKFNNKERW